MIRLERKNCNMILTEQRLNYHLYHPEKMTKYEHLTGKEILPHDQRRVIEQAKFTYSPLGKAFEKQVKQLKIKEKNKYRHAKQLVKYNNGKESSTSSTHFLKNLLLRESKKYKI